MSADTNAKSRFMDLASQPCAPGQLSSPTTDSLVLGRREGRILRVWLRPGGGFPRMAGDEHNRFATLIQPTATDESG
jgi:hypothetical protein